MDRYTLEERLSEELKYTKTGMDTVPKARSIVDYYLYVFASQGMLDKSKILYEVKNDKGFINIKPCSVYMQLMLDKVKNVKIG